MENPVSKSGRVQHSEQVANCPYILPRGQAQHCILKTSCTAAWVFLLVPNLLNNFCIKASRFPALLLPGNLSAQLFLGITSSLFLLWLLFKYHFSKSAASKHLCEVACLYHLLSISFPLALFMWLGWSPTWHIVHALGW